jgi:glyoxylase-like metal-dependent hydrolase (beta-lactamase superfamily II)
MNDVARMRGRLDYPWNNGPAEGATREVARGLRWLRMTIPFPPEHINLWLIEDGHGWAIVDCGLALDTTRAAWERIFTGELGGRGITRVFVTHFHPDHIGLAHWLALRWNVEVWMSEMEWMTARGVHAESTSEDIAQRLDLYRRNGVSAELVAGANTPTNSFYRAHVPDVPRRYRRLRGGEAVTIGDRSWTPIVGRGHAPEHACLSNPADAVLICGDILLPRISPNVSVWPTEPLGDPLRDFLGSLDGFATLDESTLVLPAHGLPYRGVHERVAELRRHHQERLDAITDFTRAAPRHAVECFPLLFKRTIGANNIGLALGEALAHLHRLEAAGRVQRELGNDEIFRFRAI